MPYYTYFLQHISVFTPSSLTRLLENAGFFMERLYETGQAVFVVARKSTHSSLSHISRREHKDDTNLFNQSQLSLNRLETQLLARLQNKEQESVSMVPEALDSLDILVSMACNQNKICF